jgi:hypothetical protein
MESNLSVVDIAFYILRRCAEIVDPEGEMDFIFDVTRRLVDETAVALARKLKTHPLWVEDLLATIGMIRSSGFEGWMEKEAIERIKNEGLDKLIDETIEEVKKEVYAKTKILVRILDNVNGYSSGDAIVVSLPEALALKENGQAKTLRVLK